MELRAAKRRTWWPALVATAAALLGTAAEASLARNSGRSELLAPRALAASLENQLGANKPRVLTQDLLDQLGSSEGLEQRRPFSLDLDATLAGELVESLQNSLGANKPRVSPRPFGLFARPSRPAAGAGGQDLASALEAVGSEKLASGPKPWEPRLNVWQIQHFASISRWGAVAYARARWYDARTASWLSEDPEQTLDSPNLYAYVAWQPQMARDPSGCSAWTNYRSAKEAIGSVFANARVQGTMQVLQGAMEIGVGVAASETGVGLLAVAHGSDTSAAGLVALITGEAQTTATHQAARDVALLAGADEGVAEQVGYWTDMAVGTAASIGAARAVAARAPPVVRGGGAAAAPKRGAGRWAGRSNAELVEDIGRRANQWGDRRGLTSGHVAGTAKHTYAQDLLDRFQRRFGDRGLTTEARYIRQNPWVKGQGVRGSVRLDVVEGDLLNPTAVYDYKFGGARLSPERIDYIRRVTGFSKSVPIIGVHIP